MSRNSIRHLWVPIGALKPYGKHARQHNRAQRRKIARLVEQIGTQPAPIIVTPEFEIVDGHGLWATLREAGADQVFVAVLQNQSAAEIKALRLAINRIPEETKWDKARLRSEVGELIHLSFDMGLTGFDAAEIDSLLRLDLPEANVVEEEAAIPPLSSSPAARLGDIFTLGQHRVGCGDAHDYAFVERVRDGRLADICFTDPPYNVEIEGFASGKGRVHHREFVKASGELSSQEFFTFLNSSLDVMRASCSQHALIYAFMDFRATVSDGEWVITSYLAANAIILPITGWLVARFGRRNYFLFSILIFTIASAFCGMATSLNQLIFFRVVQGLAGGGLQPCSQGALLDAFPAEKQGTAMTMLGWLSWSRR